MTDGPSTFDYFTLAIAIVGAITGLAALGATWAQFMLSGPRLRVYGATAIAGEGVFYLSVTVENRGRTAADVSGLSLRLPDGKTHVPVGMLQWQGQAMGDPFPARLEPFTSRTWLVRVENVVRDLQEKGLKAKVTPFFSFAGKEVIAKKPVDLADIARANLA